MCIRAKEIFLNLNNILLCEQFGFRSLSTDKTLFNFTDEILCVLNNKLHHTGISCDLADAFDCVNKELLLSKLSFYRVWNIASQWFKAYLHDRRKQAETKSLHSNNSTYSNNVIKCKVSESSILSPLLFLICITDVPPTIKWEFKPLLFAVDTNIIISHSEIECFQICMNVFAGFNKWIKVNKHASNFEKTNLMIPY